MLFIVFAVIAVAALAASFFIDRLLVTSFTVLASLVAAVGAAISACLVPALLMADPANPTTSTETFSLQALGGNPGSSPVYTAAAAQGASKGEISFMYDDHGTMRQATSSPKLVSFVDDGGQPRVEVRHTKVSHIWLTPFERNGYDQYVFHVPAQKPAN